MLNVGINGGGMVGVSILCLKPAGEKSFLTTEKMKHWIRPFKYF